MTTFELPAEKVVANTLVTGDSVCVWRTLCACSPPTVANTLVTGDSVCVWRTLCVCSPPTVGNTFCGLLATKSRYVYGGLYGQQILPTSTTTYAQAFNIARHYSP